MATFSEQLKATTDAIQAKYKPELEELKAKGQKIKDDVGKPNAAEGAIGVDFDVTMKTQDIIFDVPTATMRTQNLSLDLPEFNMVQNRIVFDLPEAYMRDDVIADNPLTGKIIISVPDFRMVQNVIILDLPSVTMKTQSLSLDLPEFGTERITWKLDIPEFKAKSVDVAIKKAQAEGDELSKKGKSLAARMQSELQQAVSDLMSGKNGTTPPASQALEPYDKAIKSLMDSIDACVAKGIDPIKVPAEGGDKNLRKQLQELVDQRAKLAESLTAAAAT